jgi:hypothetical protein
MFSLSAARAKGTGPVPTGTITFHSGGSGLETGQLNPIPTTWKPAPAMIIAPT